jgi:hypothetical protein
MERDKANSPKPNWVGGGRLRNEQEDPGDQMENLKFIMKIVVFGAVLGGIAFGLLMITLMGPVILGG